jgi:hypothetical protein
VATGAIPEVAEEFVYRRSRLASGPACRYLALGHGSEKP